MDLLGDPSSPLSTAEVLATKAKSSAPAYVPDVDLFELVDTGPQGSGGGGSRGNAPLPVDELKRRIQGSGGNEPPSFTERLRSGAASFARQVGAGLLERASAAQPVLKEHARTGTTLLLETARASPRVFGGAVAGFLLLILLYSGTLSFASSRALRGNLAEVDAETSSRIGARSAALASVPVSDLEALRKVILESDAGIQQEIAALRQEVGRLSALLQKTKPSEVERPPPAAPKEPPAAGEVQEKMTEGADVGEVKAESAPQPVFQRGRH